jgi:cysteine sulfinate desulfinase/cysteine desulfurase-like protein
MEAIGATGDRGRASIRFGLGRTNTAEDIDVAIDRVAVAVDALRAKSSA